ncbi:LysR substrate-binding domain-containing protein [Sphingobium sp. EM0848]|uniref:LysR substrate-binding domain-containing protein n=1 Tax=Sphingobium sp. EM0848 TaxID=2743473 RepID=UPI00159C2A0C|nr:LysR substrate-binding domain-containing protein [Sphingobium sp. EM0848]
MHLKGLDLNLLIALDALLSEHNVTRAAERVHISQPGMSAALQKLRWHFKDELLERIGRKLELTPRARALVDPVRDVLHRARALTAADQDFDPSTAERLFRLGGSSLCSELLALPLAQRLMREAPGIRFQFDDLLADTLTRLFEGGLDCAITVTQMLALDPTCLDRSFSERPLFTDRLVIAVAKDNPLVEESLSYEQFCSLPYIETRFGSHSTSIAEQILRRQSRRPVTRFWFPSFHQSLNAVAQTDMITIAPSLLVERYGQTLPLRSMEAPLELPSLPERLFWHPRNDFDPGHRWFRDLVTQVTAEVVGVNDLAPAGTGDLEAGKVEEGAGLPTQ